MKKIVLFQITSILLSSSIALVLCVTGLCVYATWFSTSADGNTMRALQRLPVVNRVAKNPRRIDDNFQRLAAELATEPQSFQAQWDFDVGILLSKRLFIPTLMYGQPKYRYRPNIGIYYAMVWNGQQLQSMTIPATRQIKKLLDACETRYKVRVETENHGFKKNGLRLHDTKPRYFFSG